MSGQEYLARLEAVRIAKARKLFEAFGKIKKLYLNNARVHSWRIPIILMMLARERERIKSMTISRVDGVCTLRVATDRRDLSGGRRQ